MFLLDAEHLPLLRRKLLLPVDILVVVGILRDQGALAEDGQRVEELLLLGKGLDVAQELGPGDSGEGVLDLGF